MWRTFGAACCSTIECVDIFFRFVIDKSFSQVGSMSVAWLYKPYFVARLYLCTQSLLTTPIQLCIPPPLPLWHTLFSENSNRKIPKVPAVIPVVRRPEMAVQAVSSAARTTRTNRHRLLSSILQARVSAATRKIPEPTVRSQELFLKLQTSSLEVSPHPSQTGNNLQFLDTSAPNPRSPSTAN